jgi:hypothetical protein
VLVRISEPATRKRRHLVLGGQPEKISQQKIDGAVNKYSHRSQFIHLRVGQAELQVDTAGFLVATSRRRRLFEGFGKRNEVASNCRVVSMRSAHVFGNFGIGGIAGCKSLAREGSEKVRESAGSWEERLTARGVVWLGTVVASGGRLITQSAVRDA